MSLGDSKTIPHYEEIPIYSAGAQILLSIWEVKPATATVLFLPGTMTHPLFYRDFLERLAQSGFNVVGIHFVGHGKSQRTRIFTVGDLLENAHDALGYCIKRFGLPVIALGSSQGGMLAVALAANENRLAAVFAHNILDPVVPDSLEITRFPRWLKPYHHTLIGLIQKLGLLFPCLPIPINFYLSPWRITRNLGLWEQYTTDRLNLKSYPLIFLVSLFSADMSGLYDGRIRCPVILIASKGDPLFPYSYIQNLYHHLVAPHKEILTFDLPTHLLLNEGVELVLPRVVKKLHQYAR